MSSQPDFTFDFDFSGENRAALITDARKTVGALQRELGTDAEKPDSAAEAAARLLEDLNQEVAEFSAYPDVVELKEEHFTERGLAVPPQFKDLTRQSRFYWVYLPVLLKPHSAMAFNKLQCGVEFNPGVDAGHLRPRAALILPNKKFQKLFEANQSLEFHIGPSLEFEVGTGRVDVQVLGATAKAEAGVEAKLAAKSGFVAGPFTYTLKKAVVDHTAPGSEKVFWTLSSTDFIQEGDASFIVVLQVPHGVQAVRIAAALQAYHQLNLSTAGLGKIIGYFGQRVASFFRAGAPTQDKQVWDITASL